MAVKQDGLYFVLFPKQGIKLEGVVLNRVCILGIFLSRTGSAFQNLSGSPTPKYSSSIPPGFRTVQVIILHGGE